MGNAILFLKWHLICHKNIANTLKMHNSGKIATEIRQHQESAPKKQLDISYNFILIIAIMYFHLCSKSFLKKALRPFLHLIT